MAFRVPVPDVSVVDLTVRIKKGVRGGGWEGVQVRRGEGPVPDVSVVELIVRIKKGVQKEGVGEKLS